MAVGGSLGSDGFVLYKTVSIKNPAGSANGFYAANRLTTTSAKFYESAGTPAITNSFVESSPAVPTTLICTGARGLTGDATADKYAAIYDKFACFGLTITDAQVLALRNIIFQYETDLGRP